LATKYKEKDKEASTDFREVDVLTGSEEEIVPVEEDYVPEGYDSEEDYLADMRETYQADLDADDDNRRAALEDKKFTAGEQWDSLVLEQRKGLPCLTLNTIPQFTAQLVGDWRTNRNAVKVIPAENGDVDIASIRSDLVRAIETESRAPRVYDNAFESMVQCGDGALRVDVKYADDDVFDQKIMLNSIDDVLSTVWDRLSIDPTGRDATHVFVDDLLPEKEFKRKWPEADPSNLNDQTRSNMRQTGWFEPGAVRVTEHWRMIERKVLLVMFEDGAVYSFDKDQDPEKLNEYIDKHGAPMKSRLSPCKYAQMHLVTGFKILAGPYEWKLNRLPIIRMSGRVVSVGERRVRYGLVRYMKDAVRLRNFWRSVAAEQLGYAPKAQWIATESAVEGREDLIRKAHLTRDPLLIVNDEAQIDVTIKRIDPPQPQMALLNESQVNSQDMKDITGIHDASLGIKSNETSGRAIMARQREGDIASLTYYDNGNACILEVGDVINQLIGQIYDGTRIIRVIGEDEAVRLQKINDPNDPNSPNIAVGKYDVAITTGASYTTRRVEAAEAMMEAVQVFPQMMEVAGDLVAKAQDWPGAEELSNRLRQLVPPHLLTEKERQEMQENGGGQQPGPDPQALMEQQAQVQEAMQKMQEELVKLREQNLKLTLNAEVETRKLEIDEFKAETDRMKTIGELAAKDEDFRVRELEAESQMEDSMMERQLKRETAATKASSGAKASTQPSD
jgi:hypothetical protein